MPNRIKQLLHAVSEMDLESLRESIDIECKLAQGIDGKGSLPRSLWDTYSSFANTSGGIIVLGVKELLDGSFEIHGVENPENLKQDFFNTVNNPQKVSVNLVSDSDLVEKQIDGKTVLFIAIQRASREEQPVYLHDNPNHAFIRQHEGDYRIQKHHLSRMFADKALDCFDDDVLPYRNLSHLDLETLRRYRHLFTVFNPSHITHHATDEDFLKHIGGIRFDKETGKTGLTKAALLMFGQARFINEEFPYYFLDYREVDEQRNERWIDRIVPDLSWSGNLFDFYARVVAKLTADLKVPFTLKDNFRVEDSPVHEALREALANTLVHADYSDRSAVLIIKSPSRFVFRNPGRMRTPIDLAYKGNHADCRNRTLQQMFRFIRIGEQAGSGIPKILTCWKSQNWQAPIIKEFNIPTFHTELTLNMVDFLSQQVTDALTTALGTDFQNLSPDERRIITLCSISNGIDHASLLNSLDCHPADLSKILHKLTKQNFLHSTGGRYAAYTLSNHIHKKLMSSYRSLIGHNDPLIGHNASLIGHSAPLIGHNDSLIGHNDSLIGHNALLMRYKNLTIVEDLSSISKEKLDNFAEIASKSQEKARLTVSDMHSTILELCKEDFLTLNVLAQLLNRNADTLRKHHLTVLVEKGQLELAYPDHLRHKKQAYKTKPTQ